MVDSTGVRKDMNKIKYAKSYIVQKFIEIYDDQCSELARHIEEELSLLKTFILKVHKPSLN